MSKSCVYVHFLLHPGDTWLTPSCVEALEGLFGRVQDSLAPDEDTVNVEYKSRRPGGCSRSVEELPL